MILPVVSLWRSQGCPWLANYGGNLGPSGWNDLLPSHRFGAVLQLSPDRSLLQRSAFVRNGSLPRTGPSKRPAALQVKDICSSFHRSVSFAPQERQRSQSRCQWRGSDQKPECWLIGVHRCDYGEAQERQGDSRSAHIVSGLIVPGRSFPGYERR